MKACGIFATPTGVLSAICAVSLAMQAVAVHAEEDKPWHHVVNGDWSVASASATWFDGTLSFGQDARVSIANESQFASAGSNGVAIAVATCGFDGMPAIANYNFGLKPSGRIDLRGGSRQVTYLAGAPAVTHAQTFEVAGVWTVEGLAPMTVDGTLRFASGARVAIADESLIAALGGEGVVVATASGGIDGVPEAASRDFALRLSADGKSLIAYDNRSGIADWTKFSRKLTVTFRGVQGGVELANFPALVKLSTAIPGFSYADFKRANGGDLRFADSAGNLIPHEIDTWNESGVSTVWVKVPSLSTNATVVAYYGCRNPAGAMPSKEVWDSDYVGVWHLGEGDLPMKDSSDASWEFNDYSGRGMVYAADGIVGGAVDFSKANKYAALLAPDHDALDGFSKFTIEVWMKQAERKKDAGILAKRQRGDSKTSYYLCHTGNYATLCTGTNAATSAIWTYNLNPSTNEWNYLAYGVDMTSSSMNTHGYRNGSGSGASLAFRANAVPNTPAQLSLGNMQNGASFGNSFNGQIDEVRISRCVRSADWIKATHDTVRNADFASYAVEALEIPPPVFAKEVSIEFTGYSGASLANFPVLVRLSECILGFSYADFQIAKGGDLRFFDAAGNLLPHEIDTWDPNGVSTVWVKVPALSASTAITAKYGCEEPPDVSAKDVWDDGYLGVWHLGAASGNSVQADSTRNGKDFSVNVNNSDGVASGAEGAVGRAAATGLRSDGKGCFSMSDADKLFAGRSAFTVETWTRQDDHEPAQNPKLRYVLAHSGSNVDSYDWRIYENNKGKLVMQFYSLGSLDSNAAKIFADDSAPRPVRAQWNHTAFAWNGSNGQLGLYLGGNPLTIASSVLTNNWKGTMAGDKVGFNLGNHRYSITNSFKGWIDEVRISKVARSAAWIKATHDTIANTNFATYAVAGAEPPVVFAKEVNVAFTGYSGGASLADFPVLVRLSENIPGFRYSDFQIANGGDLRFFDSHGNLLAHEIDTWNPGGVSTAWVKVPTLDASAAITAKYGCANPQEVSAKDVWDADYVGVWHLGESKLPLKESSETSSDFTREYGSAIGYAADGVVGGSVNFPAGGQNNSIVANDHDALDGFSKFTIEVWTFQSEHKMNAGILSKRKTNASEMAYYLFGSESASGTKTVPLCVGTNRNVGVDWTYHMPQTFGAWNHLAYSIDMTASKSNMRGFKNGKANSWVGDKRFLGEMGNCASDLCLGNLDANGRDTSFNGRIDEVRISKAIRSEDWIKATYETVMNPGFATYSTVSGTLSGFAAWMNANELSGAFDETAAKGIPNGVRYAFDIGPEKGPSQIGDPIIKVVFDENGNPAVQARALANGRDDVVFGVLATPDLADWDNATLVPMKKFADGFWKPSASENNAGYEFPATMFFRYLLDVR